MFFFFALIFCPALAFVAKSGPGSRKNCKNSFKHISRFGHP